MGSGERERGGRTVEAEVGVGCGKVLGRVSV